MYFLSCGATDGSEILFPGSREEDLRTPVGGGGVGGGEKKEKPSRDTVNDKFPAATFVPRYPTLNSVYASLSKM